MNETIFRAYDIRGIYGSELDDDLAYQIGRAFGTKLRQNDKYITVVGYDNRTSSVPLFNALTKGITSAGVDVINIGLVTTPMYYFAWQLFKTHSGIMITASHNPKEYNGFKLSFNGLYNTYGNDIQYFKEFIKTGNFIDGEGKLITENIKTRYLDFIFEKIKLGKRRLKVVLDAGNGAASIIIKEVIDRLNVDIIPLYIESDPDYPHHHPDPSVYKNLEDLSDAVKENKADVGFAYDGDADRIGLVDELGEPISIDKFMIIIMRNIINTLDDKRILFDVKCSKALEDEILKMHGTPVLSQTGNSYLRARIVKDNIKFGGELSGHVFFNDKFPGYDDGIYASLRMMEILSHTEFIMSELLSGINEYVNTPELKIKVTDDTKFEIVNKVKEYAKEHNYPFIDIDGCKVTLDDAFVLVRASNTGPDLTLRFEAKTKKQLDLLQAEFTNLINKLVDGK